MADIKRKTANLFSDKLIGTTWWDGVIVADERFTLHIAEVKPNTEYTASGNNSVDNIMVTYYSVYPVEGQSSVDAVRYVYPTDPTRSVATFTTPDDSRIKYAAVRFGSDATDVMFNLGSTALPYEPYGWVNSLRKLGTATDTITTLPADVYADGNNATVGLKGNMSQSGTPTPQNPIQPQETGGRTVNQFNKNDVEDIRVEYNGVESASNYYILSTFIPVNNGVTVSATKLLTDPIRIIRYDANKQFISRTDENTADNIVVDDCAYIRINANKDHWNINTIQVEYGRTATSYEPYGYKLDISSASTTTPIYLGEVETTRRIRKLVLTGEEEWEIVNPSPTSRYFRLSIGNMDSVIANMVISTHYMQTSINSSNTNNGVNVVNSSSVSKALLSIRPYNVEDIDLLGWQNYLRQQYATGTPVCVWYVLATPETAVVNEPLRKIGDYADTVSGITIPTITGKDSFDILTTLKPSEASLAYTGWHDASVKEKSRNLFDKSTAISGERILARSVIADATVAHSDYIDVTGISNLAVSHKYTGTNFYFYSDKTNDSIGYVNGYTADVPTGAKYCRINIQIEDLNNTMLNTGSSALPYEPYWT